MEQDFLHCSHHPKEWGFHHQPWWKSITKQRDPSLGNHRTPRTPPHPSCRSYRLRTKASRTRQRKELALWPWRARGQRRKVRFKNLKIDGHKHGTTHSYVYCTVQKLGDLRNEVYEVTVLLMNIQMHEMLQSGDWASIKEENNNIKQVEPRTDSGAVHIAWQAHRSHVAVFWCPG